MSDFKRFKDAVAVQYATMINRQLFSTQTIKDVLWDLYLDSFPPGTNEIFRERREYDCQSCKSFIRRAGNLVTIDDDNQLVSIWDIKVEEPYATVAKALSVYVKSRPIRNKFLSSEPCAGVDCSHQEMEDGSVMTWEHFYAKYPKEYVNTTSDSVEALLGKTAADHQVFYRSMQELSLTAGETVLELIDQDSIYRGEEHLKNVQAFIKEKKVYDGLPASQQPNWCWTRAGDSPVTRVRNTALGTLLIDLSDNVPVDDAVRKFEKVMAPANYKRPKAIFTKKMVEQAETEIKDLGLEEALGRRFAVLDDITVNNVLFVDREAKKAMGVFDELKDDVAVSPKKFSKVEEVSVDDFVANILPHARTLELMMEGKHTGNLMSLIAPQEKDAGHLFKWDNNFSWNYNGDIADSMKQRVKEAGGNAYGILRYSIQWNDELDNPNDFDAHCIEPNGNLISYPKKTVVQPSTGVLDVDIIDPGNKVAVENITWIDENKMQRGNYQFFVHCYSHNGGRKGFTAEVEYNGDIHTFTYDKELKQGEKILVASIDYVPFDCITFRKSLDSSLTSRTVWGINTNNFTKVTSLMMSPNYWDEQKGNGNRHFFFIMDNCVTEGTPRGFYNEFLKDDLLKHKRVFEALGSKMRVAASDKQLSGLGFSSTQRNSVVAKVDGVVSRMVKINF